MLSHAQAAYNLGLTSQDALKALVVCAIGISDAGYDKLHTLRHLDSHFSHLFILLRWKRGALDTRRQIGIKQAQRWSWDFSLDGYVYNIIFMLKKVRKLS